MTKILIGFFLLLQFTFAYNVPITGKWHDASRILENGQETIEKSYLTLQANGFFSLLILVSVKKGDAFIKDLRVEINGTWKAEANALVYVVKNVNIPAAKEVYLINQRSLEALARAFKNKYQNDSIHISKIKHLDAKNLMIITEKGKERNYKR